MRIGEVIGKVTLSRCHPSAAGFRWVIAVPCSYDALVNNRRGDGEDLVVLDEIGAGIGSRIGFSEGVEAAMPFHPAKKPIDAYCACILDQITVNAEPTLLKPRPNGETGS
jgi:ethanolamine utilization protein EutN